MRSAVLYICFNRPAVTARVMAAIRAAQPPRLYISCDGARHDRAGEADAVASTRAAATTVDWPCEVRTRFLDTNIGVDNGIATAIDWFFAHEAEGIVLEDDMLPHPDFFPFAEALLERYRDDKRIGLVSGLTLLSANPSAGASYAFSRYFHMWGWATWRRVWAGQDRTLADWPDARRQRVVENTLDRRPWGVRHWNRAFARGWRAKNSAWDTALQLSLWRRGLVSIVPATNLVTNIGFGAGATFTTGPMPGFMRRAVPRAMTWPLRHPARIAADPAFDARIEREALRIGPWSELKTHIRRALGPMMPLIDRWRSRAASMPRADAHPTGAKRR